MNSEVRAPRLQTRIARLMDELREHLSPKDWRLVLVLEELTNRRAVILIDDAHRRGREDVRGRCQTCGRRS